MRLSQWAFRAQLRALGRRYHEQSKAYRYF